MALITLRNGRKIQDFTKPYVVAEMGTNHAGSMEKVMEMIDKGEINDAKTVAAIYKYLAEK